MIASQRRRRRSLTDHLLRIPKGERAGFERIELRPQSFED
jgi:hypothetical protein